VIVTGAGQGLGRAHALEFARHGARLVLNDVGSPVEELAAEIRANGGEAVASLGDVSDWGYAAGLVDTAVRTYVRLDTLVNNAGINRDRSIRKMSAGEWDEVIQTNLNSVFHCSKAVLEPMIARGWGRIINIASIIGQTGAYGQANYAASKAGVIAFTKSVAQEVAKFGVTVNAICPGFVDTDMVASMPQAAKDAVKGRIPLGRFGDADEVARLVRFLCTEGDWITGAQLNINGGQYM
jgi:NAD(P)-dependent dehydrogenase (short-subunit alcohol dehydrogenase family)